MNVKGFEGHLKGRTLLCIQIPCVLLRTHTQRGNGTKESRGKRGRGEGWVQAGRRGGCNHYRVNCSVIADTTKFTRVTADTTRCADVMANSTRFTGVTADTSRFL